MLTPRADVAEPDRGVSGREPGREVGDSDRTATDESKNFVQHRERIPVHRVMGSQSDETRRLTTLMEINQTLSATLNLRAALHRALDSWSAIRERSAAS